jgi:hypothetical protein
MEHVDRDGITADPLGDERRRRAEVDRYNGTIP